MNNVGQIERLTQNRVVKLSQVYTFAIENKLAKYNQVKQGMMHELLTGKIRLV